jgi:bifunctional non-homologous end joining protein LigD
VSALGLDSGLVLDGEDLVALDERGRPDFALLQQCMHITTPSRALVAAVAVRYVVFDLLRQDGTSVLEAARVGAGPAAR